MGISDTTLVVIDVQGKLAALMHEHERLFTAIERVIKITQALEIPVLWTEQAPDKLGPTVDPIARLLFPVVKPIAKRVFSAYNCPEFRRHIDAGGRRQVLITGIEAHVCVYQTAQDLHRHGYEVQVIADAVSSRAPAEKDAALAHMRAVGINVVSVELVACALLRTADHPRFKEVMANIKR